MGNEHYLELEGNAVLYETVSTIFSPNFIHLYVEGERGAGKSRFCSALQNEGIALGILRRKPEKYNTVSLTGHNLIEALEYSKKVETLLGHRREIMDSYVYIIDDLNILECNTVTKNLIREFFSKHERVVVTSTVPFENIKNIIPDFQAVHIDPPTDTDIRKIIEGYLIDNNLYRVQKSMVDILVELYRNQDLNIQNIEEILNLCRICSRTLTYGTLHPENFHLIFRSLGLDLDSKVYQMVRKMDGERG